MDRYKKIVLCLFLSVFSAQAGWFNDAKNWIKKAEQKIENIVTGSVKKVKSVFISDTQKPTPPVVAPQPVKKVPPVVPPRKNVPPVVAPKPVKKVPPVVPPRKNVPPVVAPQPAKKVPPVVPPRKNVPPVVAPQPKMTSSSVVVPSVGNNFAENVKLMSAMAKLRKRAETVLASHADLYGSVIMQINQMIDGFKRTNGVLSGEETIAMTAINNMNTVLSDFEAERVSSERYVIFMNDTFDWWKRTYFTEEMFNEGSSRSYDLTDEEWEAQEDALWNDEDSDTDFEGTVEIGNVMITEKQQKAAVAAVSGGLLEQLRTGEK